jgi:uncharacterized membrane protein YwzB
MTILGFLLLLVVLCLVFWAMNSILDAFQVKNPIATLVRVAFVVLVVLYLLQLSGLVTGIGSLRLH